VIDTEIYNNNNNRLTAFVWDYPGRPVPAEKFFWIFMEQEKIMETKVPTVRVGATPTGLTATSPHNPSKVFTGRMPFLPPNQQRQSTEGIQSTECTVKLIIIRAYFLSLDGTS